MESSDRGSYRDPVHRVVLTGFPAEGLVTSGVADLSMALGLFLSGVGSSSGQTGMCVRACVRVSDVY